MTIKCEFLESQLLIKKMSCATLHKVSCIAKELSGRKMNANKIIQRACVLVQCSAVI